MSGVAPSSRLQLVVFHGGRPEAFPLPRNGEVVIGRGRDADVRVDDDSLSRRHAKLRIGGLIVVEDLKSRNGTRVRGNALAPGEVVEIHAGEAFAVGRVVCVLDARGVRKRERSAGSTSSSAAAKQDLASMIALVAGSDISCVLFGETGAGKEVAARAIHDASQRKGASFVALNCAALPETLLESELFGFEKGAFSGAQGQKPGLLEVADGGTVFLDEIGEMAPTVQAKLLRVIESRAVMRLGALKPRNIDVRFLSASHRRLDDEVAAGRFREDLFFRVNGITLRIPPLRERTDEILPLARRFLAEASGRAHREPPVITDEASELLLRHAWPGNVRELKNAIERALLFCAGGPTIGPAQLTLATPPRTAPTTTGTPSPSTTATGERGDERARIVRALEQAGGNQHRAAEILGISRRTLVNRIIEHGLPRPRKG